MENENLNDFGIAILHSVVRGVHVYRSFPQINTILTLKEEPKSPYRFAVGMCENNLMVGHIDNAHAKLTCRWLRHECKVHAVVTDDTVKWSKRAGGHEIAMDICVLSKDEQQMQDLQLSFFK